MAGAVALPLAALALPDAPPDIEQELLHFVAMEEQAINAETALMDKAAQGKISDAEYAAALQRDVLAPWVEVRGRMEALVDLPYADPVFLSRLVEYMRAREASWQMRMEGLRRQDRSKLDQADDMSMAADAIAEELSATLE